jgi:response regulator of citrate/malate metabolism
VPAKKGVLRRKILGFCTYHDHLVDQSNVRCHEDGSTCKSCTYLFTKWKNIMSVREYAAKYGISEATVRARIKRGIIEAEKIYVQAGGHPKYGYEKFLINGDSCVRRAL